MSHHGDSDTDSMHSSAVADLDAHIAITQAQIGHLKKAGRIQFIRSRAEAYRPNKSARKEIKDVTERLQLMYEAHCKAKQTNTPKPICPNRKTALYKVLNITNRQKGGQCDTECHIANTVSRIMLIAKRTDISLQKLIEETDKDPELNLMKQALIDKNNHQILAAYKLASCLLTERWWCRRCCENV